MEQTAAINYNATAASVQSALQSLPTIGSLAVSRTGPTSNDGYAWQVTFLSNPGDIPLLVSDVSSLSGQGRSVNVSSVTTGKAGLGGNFTLSFGGQIFESTETTVPIAYNAPATGIGSMKEAIEQLTTVGAVDVVRTNTSTGGFTWSVTFLTDPGDLPQMKLAGSQYLSGNGATVVFNTLGRGTSPLGNIQCVFGSRRRVADNAAAGSQSDGGQYESCLGGAVKCGHSFGVSVKSNCARRLHLERDIYDKRWYDS
jgi:NAD(P)-dependent dehydrogenase (short-subunit alcohol dehydrogenase family)